MNWKFLLTCCAVLLASASAMATDTKGCEAQAARMQSPERSAYIKKCLAELSDPAHVKNVQQQEKSARCEQNAKNQKLQGNERANYVASCMTKNEAVEAAKAAPSTTAAQSPAPARPKAASVHANGKGAAAKPGNSCVKQANKKGLKGDARRQFLNECTPG